MRTIKLMADYDSFPLWEASPDTVGNIDPASLPISDELKFRLGAWAASYDATLNADDPLESGFATPQAEHAFEQEGVEIADQLRAELGADYEVVVQI